MEKRGQITLFVIIGIIILLATGIAFYLTKSIEETPKPPEEIEPIVTYVQLCLEDTGVKAVNIIGQQGGYIYYPQSIEFNPFSYIELIPDSGIKLPYWYYKGRNRIPTIEEMEKDIERFVVEKVELCVNEFESFKNEFNVETNGELQAETSLTDKDVVIKLQYPLKFTSLADGKTTEFSTYISHVPAKLKTTYELANAILLRENEDLFLENAVVNLMVLDPDVPFDDMRFQCNKLRWSKFEVKNDIKEMLKFNVPRFRVRNTDIRPFSEPLSEYAKLDKWDKKEIAELEFETLPTDLPEDIYEYKQLYFDLGLEKRFRNMQVNFVYDDYYMDMNVRPSRGDVMDAGFGKGHNKFLNFMCINVFHFTYDINFPVQVVINDPYSFNGDGFNFRFATPIIIDHNLPNRNVKYSYYQIQRDFDSDICESTGDKIVKVQARDSFDNRELKDVNVSFECARFACPYGLIKLEGLHYEKNIKLPQACGPGSILGQKDGWLDERVEVPDDNSPVILYMKELVPLKLDFVRHLSDRLDRPLEIKDNQLVTFSLSDTETDFTVFKHRGVERDPDSFEIKLPFKDGSYELNIALTEDNNGEVEIVGGYRVSNWTITKDDFIGSTGITYHLYEHSPKPKDEAGLIGMFNAMDNFDIQQELAPSIR